MDLVIMATGHFPWTPPHPPPHLMMLSGLSLLSCYSSDSFGLCGSFYSPNSLIQEPTRKLDRLEINLWRERTNSYLIFSLEQELAAIMGPAGDIGL